MLCMPSEYPSPRVVADACGGLRSLVSLTTLGKWSRSSSSFGLLFVSALLVAFANVKSVRNKFLGRDIVLT